MATRILLVERDTGDYRRLRSELERPGRPLELERAATAGEALDRLARASFDVLLIDLEPPGGAGAETVRRFRDRDARLPIVVFTTAGDDWTALHALEAGAQDCVVKEDVAAAPLWCAIRIAMERQRLGRGALALEDSRPVLAFERFELHEGRRELLSAGVPIPLHPRPFDLLVTLVRKRHRVVSKRELLEEVWVGVHVSDTALSSALKELRHSLDDDGVHQRLIRTLRGHGYRFVAAVEERWNAPVEPRGAAFASPVPA